MSQNKQDNIIVPTSGGKDSTLCLALAIKHYSNVTAVFNDTGWEHPITYDYLNYLQDRFNIIIHRTTGDYKYGLTLEETIIKRKQFPNGVARFCTKHLKQIALIRWYEENLFDNKTKYDIWYGIRTGESVQREKKYGKFNRLEYYEPELVFPKLYKKATAKTILIRFPILDLHESQVKLWLKKLDIELNPLYSEGTNDRVGCYPCMLATRKKQEAMFATEFGKTQVEKIRILENKIGMKYQFPNNDSKCMICQM